MSMSLSSCFTTFAIRAWSASITRVIRLTPGVPLGPAIIDSTVHLRRAHSPATRTKLSGLCRIMQVTMCRDIDAPLAKGTSTLT